MPELRGGLPVALEGWAGLDGRLASHIVKMSSDTLSSYRAQPIRVEEDAGGERDVVGGGYSHRQIVELVQNAADSLWIEPSAEEGGEPNRLPNSGRIEVRLVGNYLYCADNGDPISKEGVVALAFSRLSTKRGTSQIGTFGLGFKSVLGVSDSPEFYSRPGSFCFDRERSQSQIREVAPESSSYPVLRLPEPVDPDESFAQDATLAKLAEWATNIVRLPLKPGTHEDLRQQMVDFPAEFLLLVSHVRSLELSGGTKDPDRRLELEWEDNEVILADGEDSSRWRLFWRDHHLSEEARADQMDGDERETVEICWAAPVKGLERNGEFWAYFPTATSSLVPGILNAPWKTDNARQFLLPGSYNDELVRAAAELIVEVLPLFSTSEDPARHLDVLPRGHQESDSEQADLLRQRIFAALRRLPVVPDQDGVLRGIREVSYPPDQLTKEPATPTFDLWAEYLARPSDWLHHKAISRDRLATINRLFLGANQHTWRSHFAEKAPRATIAEWLEALAHHPPQDEAVAASAAAIQLAAHLSETHGSKVDFGCIVLTAGGKWSSPDPDLLLLPDISAAHDRTMDLTACVHPELASDSATLSALRSLGLKEASPETQFKRAARQLLSGSSEDDAHGTFWIASRSIGLADALAIIRECEISLEHLRCRALSGTWQQTHSLLLPGKIVPDDGTRDDDLAVDMSFHGRDEALLRELGMSDVPVDGRDLKREPLYEPYLDSHRNQYFALLQQRGKPNRDYLDFETRYGVGPLEILTGLTEEGRARLTDALLSNDATYKQWEMGHTSSRYPTMKFESPTVFAIREHGLIRTEEGVVRFADALGPEPQNALALYALLRHPNADKIKQAFNLSEPTPEFFGAGDPTPLVDFWPGLQEHLEAHLRESQLVPCQEIQVAGAERRCVFHAPDVYLVGNVEDDEREALMRVSEALGLGLKQDEIEEITERITPAEVEERRATIRELSTDAERLLAAVGEKALRSGLSPSLLDALLAEQGKLTGIDIAEAAIATFDTGALKEFKHALTDLAPPSQLAGSRKAISFVRSLGFSEEWAGQRNRRRPAYLEVEGPIELPDLHPYQEVAAKNIRDMLRSPRSDGTGNRGMLTMPTGSGKTRVAVQAIVGAITEGEFSGGVLWVADRDELCEQAVEAWRQAWRSFGTDGKQLRISRMWEGQPSPLPTTERHVVVATIQTLHSRLTRQGVGYEFLKDFKLVVFDEAHRSIAPTSTAVFSELGLTYRRQEDEPFLLGLTATPYRGRDEDETARLVNRYGQNRLDAGAFDSDHPREVLRELQGMGVLADVDQELIDGGTYRLNESEQEEISKFSNQSDQREQSPPWLPQSVEDRIAQDSNRTKRIIEAFQTHVEPGWPTLIFATSVEHAQTLAALLSLEGITARAVSGKTETVTRRRVVEGFRSGDIEVLVNYGVFREGFDAPKTRAIIVARPVYSPNLYFQMIGRGLRGPLNGGDERCLILNVQDNIEEFGAELAFQDLEWLWGR